VKPPAKVLTKMLTEEPYASVVCYPRASPSDIKERIQELQPFVEAVEFVGKTAAFGVPVLGKGYVGIVVVAHVRGERLALKMRRHDADRRDLKREAEMLQKANAVGVGPRFVSVSKNFLLSQLIEGDLLVDWLKKHKDKAKVRNVLVGVLEQCWHLDEAGLDHGELSKAPKHLLVDKAQKPFIVDFETASNKRKVANVTAVCQFLFRSNSDAAKLIAETFGKRDETVLVKALKCYKKDRCRLTFKQLLKVCLS
jgi:putative serine/threonine protein kinase